MTADFRIQKSATAPGTRENVRSVAVMTGKETNWCRVIRTNSRADFAVERPRAGGELDKNKVNGPSSFLPFAGSNEVLAPGTDLASVGCDLREGIRADATEEEDP